MHPHPACAQTQPQLEAVHAKDDLARLREEHPGWNFESVWITANSGPDRRRIRASRNGAILSAWNAADLSKDIKREQAEDTKRGEGRNHEVHEHGLSVAGG
jgi:hypothetical protein